ncbi:alanine:cation symporter family protein [Faecalimicrobium dakarense]|uniref:alanine:cation symporter family protein n=1 Tax=Faecalimicrobium dakarense TaxID=1301100 RepID=UPI0004AD733E|nr:alanine:cation symporter family protein [[Clostridium] dakarense]
MLHQLEAVITKISDMIWPVFLPFILITGAMMSIRTIFMIQKKATTPAKLQIKNVIGPASISLGAMIGTGAIIGVLGALSKLAASGERNIEAMAIWALIGACIMVPVSYAETLNSKIMGKTPKEYISSLISPKLGLLYAVCFVALAVFGFGGFQFSGIDSVSAIVFDKFGMELSLVQRYMFIVVPVIAVVAALVLSKKHELFMGAMTYMIGTAVAGYFIFFTMFVIKTSGYIPTYVEGIIQGMTNPVNGFAGIVLGFVLGMQKIIQTAETGLGALAMAAQESDSKPREAAMISLIPTVVTVVVSIVVTSYIASYGLNNGIIEFPADAVTRLSQYFATAEAVTGTFGLVVLCVFTVLSALTTILGSYYYMTKLFKQNPINKNIAIYLALIIAAGTLAVFGANVVFEAVDLLLFVLSGINVTALLIFSLKKWQEHKLENSLEDKKVS